GLVTIRACATDNPSVCDQSRVHVMMLRSTVVNFDLGKALLDSDARSKLDLIIQAIKSNPRATVRVEGHADTIPPAGVRSSAASKRYNFTLLLARADSATSYLIGNGVDRSRFEPR